MVHVALVGFGLSGRYLQGPFFQVSPHYQLKTVVTQSSNPQEVFPEVEVARSLDEVLNDPTIDLVSICSPNVTHFDYAQRALLAGKHVLVEKPFTSSVEEAETLIALAKKQGKVLSVFQNRRFDSDFLTVKKVVESGMLGELLSYEAHFDRYRPVLSPKKWKEVADPGTGTLFDLGAHLIDQTLTLFGKPQSVWGHSFTQRENSQIADAFDIRMDYGTLKVTLKSSLLVREDSPRHVLHGRLGSFIKYGMDVQEDQSKAFMLPNTPDFGKEPASQRGILHTEFNGLALRGHLETVTGNWWFLFDNLYQAITQGEKLLIEPESILEQLRIMEMVSKA
jgi:predicted dehydrogenase